jgi:hypothetical protein
MTAAVKLPPVTSSRPQDDSSVPRARARGSARRLFGRRNLRYLYVIELDNEVRKERRFVKVNPLHDPPKPCVYVGVTGRTPEERFANHMRGYKANRYVYRYGIRLLPHLYDHLNPMSYAEAMEMEGKLAARLREEGYGVWQN